MALDANNYKYVTPIQQKVIDEGILAGQNMIITAESGSGKTLSYLLPILNHLNSHKDTLQSNLGILDTAQDNIEKTNAGFYKFNNQTEDKMF